VTSNSLHLTASIAAAQALRYTPAGVAALDLRLEHSSQRAQPDGNRTVNVAIGAVAFGTLAERLVRQSIGSVWRFSGFLANARQGKSVVFHIQEFLQD